MHASEEMASLQPLLNQLNMLRVLFSQYPFDTQITLILPLLEQLEIPRVEQQRAACDFLLSLGEQSHLSDNEVFQGFLVLQLLLIIKRQKKQARERFQRDAHPDAQPDAQFIAHCLPQFHYYIQKIMAESGPIRENLLLRTEQTVLALVGSQSALQDHFLALVEILSVSQLIVLYQQLLAQPQLSWETTRMILTCVQQVVVRARATEHELTQLLNFVLQFVTDVENGIKSSYALNIFVSCIELGSIPVQCLLLVWDTLQPIFQHQRLDIKTYVPVFLMLLDRLPPSVERIQVFCPVFSMLLKIIEVEKVDALLQHFCTVVAAVQEPPTALILQAAAVLREFIAYMPSAKQYSGSDRQARQQTQQVTETVIMHYLTLLTPITHLMQAERLPEQAFFSTVIKHFDVNRESVLFAHFIQVLSFSADEMQQVLSELSVLRKTYAYRYRVEETKQVIASCYPEASLSMIAEQDLLFVLSHPSEITLSSWDQEMLQKYLETASPLFVETHARDLWQVYVSLFMGCRHGGLVDYAVSMLVDLMHAAPQFVQQDTTAIWDFLRGLPNHENPAVRQLGWQSVGKVLQDVPNLSALKAEAIWEFLRSTWEAEVSLSVLAVLAKWIPNAPLFVNANQIHTRLSQYLENACVGLRGTSSSDDQQMAAQIVYHLFKAFCALVETQPNPRVLFQVVEEQYSQVSCYKDTALSGYYSAIEKELDCVVLRSLADYPRAASAFERLCGCVLWSKFTADDLCYDELQYEDDIFHILIHYSEQQPFLQGFRLLSQLALNLQLTLELETSFFEQQESMQNIMCPIIISSLTTRIETLSEEDALLGMRQFLQDVGSKSEFALGKLVKSLWYETDTQLGHIFELAIKEIEVANGLPPGETSLTQIVGFFGGRTVSTSPIDDVESLSL
ncbi:MAG: hypothetical protein A3J38_08160 [Gammaproteobacteria bacterium RIFCSPHIGHO2_12_FULL_45_9]|nr:MAG: hypothetical protein A3J38_08160 [Gammaproteobacteria bacterium RIFCSPHIGHO2_12_FULL_45_9]